MSRTIDLRSDTVTQPTPAMRQAMYEAEVGDDVFGEDPTINRLEAMAADRMGKEAALFITSGTMGNLIGVLGHCGRGDEAIVGDQAHVLIYEVAGAAAIGGVQLRPVPNRQGAPDLADIERAFRGDDIHVPRTALVCLENTHNRCGGAALSREQTDPICRFAHANGASTHLDGARIFNAAISLGVPPSHLAAEFDSVTFCLSKGLAAPVGSVLCGSQQFIKRARKLRKSLGGGMRQAGILAAAGIVALEQMVDRLAEDHAHARYLAEGLATIPGLSLDPKTVDTNIVVVEVTSPRFTAPQLLARLREEGLRVTQFSPTRVRMVTHYGIEKPDIDAALEIVRRVMA